MHKDSTTQAKQKKDEREEVLKEIRQLENRQKILENKQRNEERKARTRRLIERGAILEGVFPLAPDLPGVEGQGVPDCSVLSSGGGGTGRKTAEIRGQAVSPLFTRAHYPRYSTIRGNFQIVAIYKDFKEISSDNVTTILESRQRILLFPFYRTFLLLGEPFLVPIPDMPVHSPL